MLGACVTTMVTAGDYAIDATEVTARQYSQFLESGEHGSIAQPELCMDNTAFSVYRDALCVGYVFDPEGAPDLPIVCVDWCDAHAYCHWVGKRLCGALDGGSVSPDPISNIRTMSQWYLACSAGGSWEYAYGDEYDASRCNTNGSGLVPVGSSPDCEGGLAGLYDMAGNAVEFEDSYAFGPPASYWFRLRGGGHADGEKSTCHSTVTTVSSGRWWARPDTGFRCCSP
jgi:sulfatase modifying factor 1